MSVILGYYSAPIDQGEDVDPTSTFAGGQPAWLSKDLRPNVPLTCQKCGRPLFLVLQAFAPLPQCRAPYRSLWLFACNRRHCSKTSAGWLALRGQFPPPDDWQWKDNNNNNDNDNDNEAEIHVSEWEASEDAWCSSQGDVDLVQLLEQRDQAYKARDTCSSIVQTEHSNEKPKVPRQSDPHPGESTDSPAFSAFYVEVDVEPEAENYSVSKEMRLYEEYRAREREEGEASSDPDVDGRGTGDEQYESLPDKAFWNFQKRIARSPEQCIRYCFGGTPLWPLPWTSSSIPRCGACGAERVPELQLIPTLLYYLRPQDHIQRDEGDEGDEAMEWSTVVVFACAKSCQASLQGEFHQEFVVVQEAI